MHLRCPAELEVWFAEIKLRASIRIGELVGELETAERARTDLRPTAGTQTKEATIADAGLSRSDSYRCQELAGGKMEAASVMAHAAAEAHFTQARDDGRPATLQSLRCAF